MDPIKRLNVIIAEAEAAIRDIESTEDTLPDSPRPGQYHFSQRSLERMEGIHIDLLAVAHYAIRVTRMDFGVTRTGGVRSEAMQKELVDKGVSWTMNSRHRTGHALDVVAYIGGAVSWELEHALVVHEAFAKAGKALGVPLRWGGDWDGDGDWRDEKKLDAYHHELSRSEYGDDMAGRSVKAMEFLTKIGVS